MKPLPDDWPNVAHSRFVRSAGVDWHVQIAGDGPVVLLLHGTGGATHSWRDMLPALADQATVVAVDFPGHGFTRGRPAGGMSVSAIARGVASLLRELALDPAVIVGHSAGMAVAVRMATEADVPPRALVGLGAALLPFPGLARDLFPALAKLLFVNPLVPYAAAKLVDKPGMMDRFVTRTGSRIDARGVALYRQLFSDPEQVAGMIAMMAAWDLVPVEAALSTLAMPVLLIHGDRDNTIPIAAARKSAALIRECTLTVLPGLGHLAHEEAPERVAALILDFAQRSGALP